MGTNHPLTDNDYNRLPFHLAARPVPKQHSMAMASCVCPKCKHSPAVYKWGKLDEPARSLIRQQVLLMVAEQVRTKRRSRSKEPDPKPNHDR